MPTRGTRYYLPNRVDRYVLTEVAGPFLGGLIFFLLLFLMFQALRLAEFFIVHGVGGGTLMKLTLLLGLSFVPTALPVAFLISVLVAFGRLSSDHELVALKASGVSVPRLALPLLAFAMSVVGLSVALNVSWCPWGERAFKSLLIKVSNTKVVTSIKEGTFTSGFFDLLIFADKVDVKTNTMKHVFIFDEREPKNPLTVVAQTGEIVPVKASSELGAAIMLRLHDGSIHRNDPETTTYQKIGFGEYRLYLKIDEGSSDATIKPHMIPQQELLHRIADTNPHSYEGLEMRGEYWRRYAVAITPLIFVFLGIGWGTVRTRAVRAGAVLVALVTLLTYWSIQSWATVQMLGDKIQPFWAMQLPNILLLAAAIFGFRRALW
jgi:lipopolysaccharide export system permease protein